MSTMTLANTIIENLRRRRGFDRAFDLDGDILEEIQQEMADAIDAIDALLRERESVHPDDIAVDAFATKMKEKLAEARAKGRGGWENKDDCSQLSLSELLRGHVEKGDPRDVANFCMFLYSRGEGILPATRESAKAVVTDEIAETASEVEQTFYLEHSDTEFMDSKHFSVEAMRAALEAVAPMLTSAALPIPMILHCPSCGVQHIDAPEDMVSVHMDGRETVWDNPPHRSHLCHNCGIIWRPADVPTTGVKTIRTKGKNDADMPAPMLASARVPDGFAEKLNARLETLEVPESLSPSKAEYWKSGARRVIREVNAMLAAAPKPEAKEWEMKIAVIISDSAHLINVGGEIVRTVKMFDVPPEMQAYIEKAMKYPQYISISVALEDQQP